jgi:hypothetical protein
MPVYQDQPSIAAGATLTVPLQPNDRFGGRGGTVRVRSVATSGASSGLIKRTYLVGNEQIERNSGVLLKATGVDNFTPAVTAMGAPADPIVVQFFNSSAGAIVVDYVVEIENNP